MFSFRFVWHFFYICDGQIDFRLSNRNLLSRSWPESAFYVWSWQRLNLILSDMMAKLSVIPAYRLAENPFPRQRLAYRHWKFPKEELLRKYSAQLQIRESSDTDTRWNVCPRSITIFVRAVNPFSAVASSNLNQSGWVLFFNPHRSVSELFSYLWRLSQSVCVC